MLGLSLPPRIKSPAGSCLSPPSQVGPVLCKSGLIGRVEQAERKDQKFLSHLLAQAKLGGGALLSGCLWLPWLFPPHVLSHEGPVTLIHNRVTVAQKG